MGEAAAHPHNASRATFAGDPVQPSPAPRFSATPGAAGNVQDLGLDAALARWS
jgi:alpha-methylacyl-CoA racemase